MTSNNPDTSGTPVFHVTHWKAGSQWVRAVFDEALPGRVVPDASSAFFGRPIARDAIYTPVYATVDQFRSIVPLDARQRTFALIRDPRDTAVSWYFSHLYSHPKHFASVGSSRLMLEKLNKTDGLAVVISAHLYDAVAIQQSWLAAGAKVFRYEDLLADQHGVYEQIFDYCELDIPASRRKRIVDHNSFARKTWWRFGRENRKSHRRKGEAGDWKNHFCDRLKALFKIHHGAALIAAGYEKDDAW